MHVIYENIRQYTSKGFLFGEAILFDQAVNSRRAKQTELDGKIANKKKLEGSIFRANIEQLAYVDDWKKRQDGDQSITVAGTKARLAPKRTLERTSSILMAGEAKELAKTLVDFFVEKVGVTEANLDNSIEAFWKIFDGDEGANKLVLGQFTQMSQVITDAGQKLTRSDMKHIFQLLDTDNSGTLEKTEFRTFGTCPSLLIVPRYRVRFEFKTRRKPPKT